MSNVIIAELTEASAFDLANDHPNLLKAFDKILEDRDRVPDEKARVWVRIDFDTGSLAWRVITIEAYQDVPDVVVNDRMQMDEVWA